MTKIDICGCGNTQCRYVFEYSSEVELMAKVRASLPHMDFKVFQNLAKMYGTNDDMKHLAMNIVRGMDIGSALTLVCTMFSVVVDKAKVDCALGITEVMTLQSAENRARQVIGFITLALAERQAHGS